jgi:DNA polymerase-3 subunit delta'
LNTDYGEIESHLDFKHISSEGSISIEQIRGLSSFVNETSASHRGKFIIIEDAEKMTINSSNACLKMLEDSPNYLYVFLVSKNPYLLPLTIKSRCRKITDKINLKESYTQEFLIENQEAITTEKNLIDFIDYLLFSINGIITGNITKNNESSIENTFLYKNINKNPKSLVDKFYYLSNLKKNIQTFHLDPRQSYFIIMEKLFGSL